MKPCEYCGAPLPLGVDKGTRRVRTSHFQSCSAKPQPEPEPTEVARLRHNVEVLTNALRKACGDDENVVQATIESQGELK